MASLTGLNYTDPNLNVRRENPHLVGGAATTTYARDIAFQTRRLKGWHGYVTTAGTATTHILTLYNGTTSIGATTLSTSTAGTTFTVQGLNALVPSLTPLNVRTGADATGVAVICYEFDIDPTTSESI